MKPKVYVMMSTYNGEKYIREQLDSILAQNHVDRSEEHTSELQSRI